MTVIATNTAALRATAASTSANNALSTAMNRLSTGKRINSAKDDAAGLAIAASMTTQIRGMNQGIRNANDGISMAQTAEGALDEVTNMLQRMRELAVQAGNGTYSDTDLNNIAAEQKTLGDQITAVLTNTTFNGKSLFGTDAEAVTIQYGANTADTTTMTFADQTGGKAGTLAADASALLDASDPAAPDAPDAPASPATPATPLTTLTAFDDAINEVSSLRAGLGAAQNQLESAVNNMTNNVNNLSDAQSRIQDADFSTESTNLAKAQILSQASTAMLAQANQSQQGVLKLLQ